jgi:tetratricopeptide (TPR) repeat protein
VGARHSLAVRYANIGERHKAIEHGEILIEKYKTNNVLTYGNLAVWFFNLGQYDNAKKTLEKYLENFPDNELIHRRLATMYCYQGKYDLALDEVDKAFALAPTRWLIIRAKGDIYFYMEDFPKAEDEYHKLMDKEEPTARSMGTGKLGQLYKLKGRYLDSIEMAKTGIEQAEKVGEKNWKRNRMSMLAEMDLMLGKPEEALKKLDIVWQSAVEDESLSYQRRTLRNFAVAYLGTNQLAQAEKAAEDLKKIIEQSVNKNHISSYYYVMGMIELEKNNHAPAIDFLYKALSLTSPIFTDHLKYTDPLGQAYFKSGDFEKARDVYESMVSPETNRFQDGDLYVKSFYMLGKIYEKQGETAKAIENYEKFLELWKDADPGIAEIEYARERLAGLK